MTLRKMGKGEHQKLVRKVTLEEDKTTRCCYHGANKYGEDRASCDRSAVYRSSTFRRLGCTITINIGLSPVGIREGGVLGRLEI